MIFEDAVPGAADEELVAVGAVGVGGFGVDVALVNVVEPDLAGDLTRAVKRLRRSGRLVLELEVRVKRGEMERNVGAKIGKDPFGELAGFGGVIVESGNHEVGDLKPDGGFIFQPLQGVQNGLEVSESNFAIEIFGEGLEVDVRGINVVVDVVEGVVGDVAVGDHDGLEAVKFGGFANVDNVFAPDGGFVVGEGDGVAAVFLGKERNLLRGNAFGADLIVMGFGNVPVLAEEATHVATGGAHAEDARAGEEMVEGLFFDGVDLKSGGRGVAQTEEFAVLIDADETETRLAVADVAVARTEITVDAAVRFGFPPKGFVEGGGALEDLERRHDPRTSGDSIRRRRSEPSSS